MMLEHAHPHQDLPSGGDGVLDIDYQIVSTPHGNLVFTCKDSDPVAMVVDAISISSALGTSQN